jgi:hypothetical protein
MADEITHNAETGLTLYACRFLVNGNVFLSNPATNEVWGTGGRDADDYDVALTEEDSSGHYKGDFASGGAIPAGHYYVVVYLQTGANPADGDAAIAQGSIDWDALAEITLSVLHDKARQRKGAFV